MLRLKSNNFIGMEVCRLIFIFEVMASSTFQAADAADKSSGTICKKSKAIATNFF